MNQVKITIDGQEILALEGDNLIEVARFNGIEIPSLCHDKRLEPFGACRQCLVEIEGYRGPVQSCGIKVTEGMVIHTSTEKITALRRLGLELLLSEHCGDCVAPCQQGCPAGIDIQGFVAHLANGELTEAVKLIREKLPLPASVGRVCPKFCEIDCRRNLLENPVSICTLKRFAGDATLALAEELLPTVQASTGKKVAVVGGGPAGLTVAYNLAIAGHGVTILDSSPALGGMMRYGIPEYRLPKAVLDQEISLITGLCENVFCNKALGQDFTLAQLKQAGFDAVFLGLGSWANQSLGLPGEDLNGVYSGIGFLGKVTLKEKVPMGKKVVIIGGGNTAMDAARTSIRRGAEEVIVVYRRSRDEMPANPEEIAQAEEEGVKFQLLTAPLSFYGEADQVKGIKCVKMQLGEPDQSGRRRPVPVASSEYNMEADMIITATGQKLEKSSVADSPEIILNQWGAIEVNQATMQGQTPWLFSGGDCVTGPATVVEAIGAANRAANSIDQYLQGHLVEPLAKPFNCSRGELSELDPAEFAQYEKIDRTGVPTLQPEVRITNFQEFELGYDLKLAQKEASRCLSCGCMDVFSCRLKDYATQLKVEPTKLGFGQKIHPVYTDHANIIRDPNKCVLCGNCVRICQELHGLAVLGFVNRGSETVVLPELKHPLGETHCNSCGQCVSICPTGALVSRSPLAKPGPWQSEEVSSVCPHCNIGCKINLNIVGDKIVQITSPLQDNPVNEGSLCPKGAYDQSIFDDPNRITSPLIKINEALTEVDWQAAFDSGGEILKTFREFEGKDSLALILAPGLTNEENYLAAQFGLKVMNTTHIYGEQSVPLGITSYEGLIADFEHLKTSDLILVFNGNTLAKYPIVTQKIKHRLTNGSKLLIVGPHASELDSRASMTIKVGKQKMTKFIQAMLDEKAADFTFKPERINALVQMYRQAKQPIIIVDESAANHEELTALTQFIRTTGNKTKSLLLLSPYGNIQGQQVMGIKTDLADHQALKVSMESGKIKGLVIIKDGLQTCEMKYPAYPRVPTIVITPKLYPDTLGDVVLPGNIYTEKAGSFINCEGRVQYLQAGVKPATGKNLLSILLELAKTAGHPLAYEKKDYISKEVLGKILS